MSNAFDAWPAFYHEISEVLRDIAGGVDVSRAAYDPEPYIDALISMEFVFVSRDANDKWCLTVKGRHVARMLNQVACRAWDEGEKHARQNPQELRR